MYPYHLFFLSRHCFVPSCLLLCICVFSSNLAIMGERNQEMGLKKNKSKKKAKENFSLYVSIMQRSSSPLGIVRYLGFSFLMIASTTSRAQIDTKALETPKRLARVRYPSVKATKYKNKAIFLTSTAFHVIVS